MRFRSTRIVATAIGLTIPGAGLVGLAACTFPQVTFGQKPDSGGTMSPELDADSPDVSTFGDDGAMADTSEGLDAGAKTEAAADGACDFNGTWATRITIAVSWQPQGLLNNVVLAPGTGQIRQFVKGVRTQAGTSLTDDSAVCDIELPDFKSTTNETYGVRFPASLFDNGYLPGFSVFGGLSPLMDGGSSYTSTETAVLIGLSLNNPATDPWPTTVTTASDPDLDGKPGVTVTAAQGPIASAQSTAYSNIPVEFPILIGQQVARANTLYLAIRQVTSISGAVQNCDFIAGTVGIQSVGSKAAIDSHILGCALVDGGDCTMSTSSSPSSQASFVDSQQPIFTPSGATEFQSIRVKTGATCADVRGATFH